MIEQSKNAAGTLIIELDRPSCCSYGVCKEICPELYDLDESGLVVMTRADIPAELEEKAIEGAEACPMAAIIVKRSEG